MKGRVLICAGSDSGGGAGIQADIKAVTALGGFAMTAITALTAQNTLGVQGVVGVEPGFIRQQMRSVLDDLGADAIKTGMLHDSPTIEAVCDEIAALAPDLPVVADPVMVATAGSRLLADDAVETLKRRLLPIAVVLTPNIPEAEALTGLEILDEGGMRAAAQALLEMGAQAVLLKGGHMEGEALVDLLVTRDGVHRYEDRRISTRHTHGTGCTLASAVAAGLAKGLALEPAVRRARAYVRAAILRAPGFGTGHGPLDHGVTVDTSRFD
ncbi:bifunctional hydroxymethylpyrimidine kinase/phosphomethylpyrimidine kinase [Roseococcus sp. SDR]|uniref:bifunctional hydroxymethylpyrimidine kinase/phosphomethylpyrimidine kinase n=1 Tax=Roseococcus sp. SDR TaxID=2835532 RepID=UPI001BCECCA2|nr:bifunctional hydroxymethylpyrimidine kinase/phosphomethylpyrimidine kinase [Roseococcus sp. SDR]MBS7789164.1 bifunctional hydroxymethylpyrimidine kinase/phosphomethylpyrimidine kinase [Roseococcus sp. SDR]MBV1844478.1 bifunctional hydroxymethylpyrimidine kinase/phosphomethylpyrimidine kinase [Roseococcus sp. SDR]